MNRVVPRLDEARLERGKKKKAAAIAEALRAVGASGDDEELEVAARFVAGLLVPLREPRTLGVGWSLVDQAACEAYRLSPADLRARAHALGDLGDAVGELAARAPEASARVGLTLRELAALSDSLLGTNDRTRKKDALVAAYVRARPDQAKYLTKALLGELRVGVREGILEDAIAAAFGRDPKEVREAAVLCTDPGELAVLACHDELARAAFVVGRPVGFMLASPIEAVKTPVAVATTAWEDKLDGIRVQAHARPGSVRMFARGGGEVSAVFPEVAAALADVPRAVVLDGELLAVTADGRPRPFQALQARLGRRDPDAARVAATPVALFAFDILYEAEEALLGAPWTERRARLDAFFAGGSLAKAAQPTVVHRLDAGAPLDPQVDAAYAAARARGHEGIVLKDTQAPYEAGRRGSAWRKVKRALATLDVVVTRAEQGHGKRAAVLSDYTFAVWNEGTLVDIGKAFSGLTDAEIAELTVELEARTVATSGVQRIVEPFLVLEVAFDGLQRSARHASGFALRFPRIARVRRDKRPEDADTLATAQALWEAQVASGHREEASPAPPAAEAPARKRRARGPKPEEPEAGTPVQLRLFGSEADKRTR